MHQRRLTLIRGSSIFYLLHQDCPTRGPRATYGPQSCFCVARKVFCEIDFFVERLTILWQIKKRSKPKPSSVWLYRNPFRFAVKTFFLVFSYFGGQIPEILAEVSTDFVRQTCNYLEFNLGKNTCGLQ